MNTIDSRALLGIVLIGVLIGMGLWFAEHPQAAPKPYHDPCGDVHGVPVQRADTGQIVCVMEIRRG